MGWRLLLDLGADCMGLATSLGLRQRLGLLTSTARVFNETFGFASGLIVLLFRYVPNRYPTFLQEQRAESRVVALYFAKCGMRDADAPARPYEPEHRIMNRQIVLAGLAALELAASAAAAGARGAAGPTSEEARTDQAHEPARRRDLPHR